MVKLYNERVLWNDVRKISVAAQDLDAGNPTLGGQLGWCKPQIRSNLTILVSDTSSFGPFGGPSRLKVSFPLYPVWMHLYSYLPLGRLAF